MGTASRKLELLHSCVPKLELGNKKQKICTLYGIRTFRQAFTPRQRYILLTMAREVRRAYQEMLDQGVEPERAGAITTYMGVWLSRLTDRCNGLARWNNLWEKIESLT